MAAMATEVVRVNSFHQQKYEVLKLIYKPEAENSYIIYIWAPRRYISLVKYTDNHSNHQS